jgi:hypothetical protein
MSKLRRMAAVAVTLSGLVAATAATAGPAAAQTASNASVAVSISVSSSLPVITHDVLVQFKGRKGTSAATVSGTVSGATAGEVAALYAQPFPFKSNAAPVPGKRLSLNGSSAQSYSFTVHPTLATRYTVHVLPGSSTASATAVSRVRIVYVVTNQDLTGAKKCGRPVCHETLRVTTRLPESAYKTEAGKKWYFYFGLRFSATGIPAPKVLFLKHVKISKARKVSATEFERTISFSFRIGNHGYHWLPAYCSKDTESKDGINLPGHHNCGVKKIRSTTIYLG